MEVKKKWLCSSPMSVQSKSSAMQLGRRSIPTINCTVRKSTIPAIVRHNDLSERSDMYNVCSGCVMICKEFDEETINS